MQFSNTKVYNFEGALNGMRNPMNSWGNSDSYFGITDIYDTDSLMDVVDSWIEYENISRSEHNLELYSHDMEYYNEYYEKLEEYENWLTEQGILYHSDNYDTLYEVAFIGPDDLHLAKRLILSGEEHAKFMRQIFISTDITAPRFWWAEMDTYKVGTVANSTSTMHKLTSKPLTIEDFAIELNDDLITDSGSGPHGGEWELVYSDYAEDIISMCENLRQKYVATKDKRYWRALIEILPQSYLQTRTWTANYAVLRNIYFQRRNHRLKEWHDFCDWITTLPYSGELITIGE